MKKILIQFRLNNTGHIPLENNLLGEFLIESQYDDDEFIKQVIDYWSKKIIKKYIELEYKEINDDEKQDYIGIEEV